MKKHILHILFLVFVYLTLLLTLKGVPGNPSPKTINLELKNEGQPFELSPERGRFALTSSVVDYNSVHFPISVAEYVMPDLGYNVGNFVSLFPPGISYFAIPLYYLGKYLNLGQVFAFMTSTVFALLSFYLILKIVEKLTNNWYAGATAGLTFLFGTSALAYSGTLYQHHATTFFVLWTLYILANETKKYSSLLAGIILGMSFFVEYNAAIFVLPALIGIIIKHINIVTQKNQVRLSINNYLFLGLIGATIALLPNFYYSYKAYGDPLKLAGTVQSVEKIERNNETGEFIPPQKVNYKKTAIGFFNINHLPRSMSVLLTSKDRGVVWFSPVIILSLLGLSALYLKNKNYSLIVVATALAVFLLYGMWGDPWGGRAFGTRYLIPAFAVMAIPLGVAISKYSKKAWFCIIFITILYYSLIVNISGALTTSVIPASVETELQTYPKPTYIYNYHLILENKSSSFLYNSYFKNIITLKNYFWLVLVITSLTTSLMLYNSQENRERTLDGGRKTPTVSRGERHKSQINKEE